MILHIEGQIKLMSQEFSFSNYVCQYFFPIFRAIYKAKLRRTPPFNVSFILHCCNHLLKKMFKKRVFVNKLVNNCLLRVLFCCLYMSPPSLNNFLLFCICGSNMKINVEKYSIYFRPPSVWRSHDSTPDICRRFVKRLVPKYK